LIPLTIGAPIPNQSALRFMFEGDTRIFLLEPSASAIQPSVPLLVGSIYCLSKYWTDRFPREPRQKAKPSECCDYERNGKQERPKLSYHNQGTLTAAVGNTMRLRF
jgi:hypothetical protein